MAMLPPSGFSSPAIERIVVVLPQPEGPSRVSTEPVGTEKLISSTARTLPPAKVFSRSVTWMDMACSSAGTDRAAGSDRVTAVRYSSFTPYRLLIRRGDDREDREGEDRRGCRRRRAGRRLPFSQISKIATPIGSLPYE